MAWNDDWTATDYLLLAEDWDSIFQAYAERMRAIGPEAWQDWIGQFGNYNLGYIYPDGLNPQPTPPPDDPPKIPPAPAAAPFKNAADLQNPAIYNLIHQLIYDYFCGGENGQAPFYSTLALGVVNRNANLNGRQLTNTNINPPFGWFKPFTGIVPPAGTVVFTSVNQLRLAAGLSDYSGKTDYVGDGSQAFRRRCPRTVLNPKTNPATPYTSACLDMEGNTCADGMLAWEQVQVFNGFGFATNTDTGRLLKFDGTQKIWVFVGQNQGEMPDILDTEKPAPNYAKMGRHQAGDYIDGHTLTELKKFAKAVTMFTGQMTIANPRNKSGSFNGGAGTPYPDWDTTKANAEAAFGAADWNVGQGSYGVGKVSREQGVAYTDGSGNNYYDAELYLTQAQFQGMSDNTLARKIDIYLVGLFLTPAMVGGIAPQVTGSFEDMAALVDSQAIKIESQNNPAGTFLSAFYPNTDIPLWSNNGAPPPTAGGGAGGIVTFGAFQVEGFKIPYAFFTADYAVAGGFAFT